MLLVGSSLVSACSDGDVGPQGQKGESGDKGAVGDTGTAGPDGQGYLVKRGSYEGTVTGSRQDGTPFTETFNFEYSDESFDAFNDEDEGIYSLDIDRYNNSSWQDWNPYLGIDITIENMGEEGQDIYVTDFDFDFEKVLDATTTFRFELNYNDEDEDVPVVTISNFSYNDVTGVLEYDFSFTYDGENTDYNSTGNPITVTGKFNSGTGKVYDEIVMRKRG
jgi:hypothetical protein